MSGKDASAYERPPDNLAPAAKDLIRGVYKLKDRSIPRQVMHWVHFPTSESRSLFSKAAADAGFVVESEYELEPGDRRFCVRVYRFNRFNRAR